MRRILRNQILFFDSRRHKLTQFRELAVHIQSTAVPLDKRLRFRFAKIRLVLILKFVLQLVYNRNRIFAALGRARVVQVENRRNLFDGARTAVLSTRNIRGRQNDSVAIQSAIRFELGNLLMITQRLVHDDFGQTAVVRNNGYTLKLVVLRLFTIRH